MDRKTCRFFITEVKMKIDILQHFLTKARRFLLCDAIEASLLVLWRWEKVLWRTVSEVWVWRAILKKLHISVRALRWPSKTLCHWLFFGEETEFYGKILYAFHSTFSKCVSCKDEIFKCCSSWQFWLSSRSCMVVRSPIYIFLFFFRNSRIPLFVQKDYLLSNLFRNISFSHFRCTRERHVQCSAVTALWSLWYSMHMPCILQVEYIIDPRLLHLFFLFFF